MMHIRRLVDLRKQARLTQKEVAQQLGIAPSTYAGYEYGTREPDHQTLMRIAQVLNASTDYLLGTANKTSENKEPESIGDRLRRLRHSRELSQKELSQSINCHQTLISKYERDIEVPTTENMKVLARFYDVSADYLLNGEHHDEKTSSDGPHDANNRPSLSDVIPSTTNATKAPLSEASEVSELSSPATAWPDLAHTLAKALQMHEETARIQAEAMKLQAENDRLRIEKVDAVAQENLRRLLDRLDQLAAPVSSHSARRDDEGAAGGHQTLVG